MAMTFSVLNAATAPGSRINEDGYGVWPDPAACRAAWVLDGVTGLNDRALLPGPSDAAWFVAQVQDLLPALLAELPAAPAAALVATLAHRLEVRQAASWLDARGADGRETPAASFTLVRVMENEVEIASLGDCLTLVEGHDGVVQVSDHPVLEEIEAAIKRDMRALRAAGVAALADVRKRMLPSLHAQRRKRNIPGGYGVLSPDQACLPLLKVRRLPATAIRRLLLVSDGYYRLVDHYGAMSDAELLAQTAALGPDELLRRLRAIEAADPEAVRFPRFKLSDDATALLLRLP
jgi:hypothetical protein